MTWKRSLEEVRELVGKMSRERLFQAKHTMEEGVWRWHSLMQEWAQGMGD